MAGQGRAIVEQQIVFWGKAQLGQAGGRDTTGCADRFKRGLGCVAVIAFRVEPGEAEDRGAVGGVADSGEGERAVQRAAQPGKDEGRRAHEIEEPRGGNHRPPHGVRR